ncbi:Protein ssh4 [Dispira parvispora]|uniref:Protein ssh4 n=1 Tax=Dispira parvispora TaxID=1520584 RepID=A0A9W8ALM4_9FUNG|nr:Protein ssh4 [Dispira parvispora]
MASKQRGHQEVGPFKYTISEQPSFANERDRLQFESAQKFETMYPYNSIPTRLTQDQYVYIEEYGVNAWQFVPPVDPRLSPTLGVDLAPKDLHHLVRVRDRTEVEFLPVGNQGEGTHEPHQECLVHTNLPLPTSSAVSYFEVKLQKKPDQTNVAIGLATKPYPTWRLCGWNKHSVGIHSDSGSLYHNSPFNATLCGEKFREGDIMGCGYIPAQGMVFFTQNGYRLPTCLTNVSKNFFPAVSANGPCQLSVNLGQRGFVYIEANVKHWGLGPIEGNLLPPPKYADAIHSTLLASADYNEDAESDTDTAVQGSSRRSSMNSDMTVDDMNPQVTHQRTPSPTRVPPGLVTVVPMDWHLHPHDLADNFSGTLPRHEQRSPIYPPTPASASLQMPEPALVHSPLLNEVDMGNSQLDQHRR